MNATAEIAAYARGWNEAQDWRNVHANPYPSMSLEWLAWSQGYDEGGANAMQAAQTALKLGDRGNANL